tara:strand:- start:4037 stop:5971 length:1935 start_codon:yes stop_codon:yes gene_type:complete
MVNLVKTFGSLAKLFSPSLKAAKDLAQKKGSYEQLKAMMIKNGAKADELEWSGADNFFEGKKVTKDEIVEYLSQNDPRLYTERRVATEGLTGEADFLTAEARRSQAIRDVLQDTDMVNEEKLNILDEMKSNPDDLVPFESDVAFGSYGDTNSEILEQIKNSADDSGSMDLDTYLKRRLRQSLKDSYDADPPSFYQRYNIELPRVFGEGDTQYSSYFPTGAERYMENLYQYTDPTEKIPFNQFAGSKHFGDDDIGTIFHTRTGDFPVDSASETGGGFGSIARYVGEIQSDPQQALKGDRKPRSYNETILVSRLNDLNEKMIADKKKLRENNRKMFANNLSEEELGRLGREAAIFQINKIIKDPTKQNDSFKDMASAFKVKDELPLDTSLMNEDELEFLHLQLYNFDEFKGVNLLAGEDKRIAGVPYTNRKQTAWTREPLGVENVQEYMASKPVDWLNEGFRRYYGNLNADNMLLEMDIADTVSEYRKIKDDHFEGGESYKNPGAPFLSSQNKWVDQALNRSIMDAVNDPNIDYLTFPDDIGAIGKVGGTDNPREGAVNFYQRDVQNRLKKLLGKFDKNAQIEQIDLSPPSIQGETTDMFRSKGFKITPEFREQVIKKGIPTYALPPIIGYGALNSMDENENGDQM